VGKRRTADDSDDLALCLGVPAVSNDEIEEVDEMGRSRRTDESSAQAGVRRARRSDRDSRRARRRAKPSRSQAVVEADDGFSTDSTLAEGDADDYQAAHSVLEQRVHALLDDVKAEDFRDPDKGLARRFGGWRKNYEEEYGNAFGGLAMVQAWEFWARGEMVGWEPLRVSVHYLLGCSDAHR
jgi:GC-rich sequence DNA-binding factor